MKNVTDAASAPKYTTNGATSFQLAGSFTGAVIEWSEQETGTEWIPQGFELNTPANFTVPQGVTLTIGTGYVRIVAAGSCDYSISDIRQR